MRLSRCNQGPIQLEPRADLKLFATPTPIADYLEPNFLKVEASIPNLLAGRIPLQSRHEEL